MPFRIHIQDELRKELEARLQRAMGTNRRLAKRILAILRVIDGATLEEVSRELDLCKRSVKNYVIQFLAKALDSLTYKRPPGRQPRLTKTQKKELCDLIDKGPEAAGFDYGCWSTAIIQELIEKRFGVCYSTRYIAELLDNLGYSYQRARFVSEHLDGGDDDDNKSSRKTWMNETWPSILELAQEKNAMILFQDEASFAQWGSLSYTWSPKGKQPTIKTSGRRNSYKVFGAIDYFSGQFFYYCLDHQAKDKTKRRFNSDTYADFLKTILAKTTRHVILIQDRAPYHTSKATRTFFEQNATRLTAFDLPPYSPDFNPIEYLWRNVKKLASHLRYHPTFQSLVDKVDDKLKLFASLPHAILGLMGKYSSDSHHDSPTPSEIDTRTTSILEQAAASILEQAAASMLELSA